MDNKLYVGNINWEASEETLRELFEKNGEVQSVKIITDKFTGRSKGFGFIEMGTQEEAEKAISEMNGVEFLGRPLKVNIARPPRKRQGGGSGGSSYGRGKRY